MVWPVIQWPNVHALLLDSTPGAASRPTSSQSQQSSARRGRAGRLADGFALVSAPGSRNRRWFRGGAPSSLPPSGRLGSRHLVPTFGLVAGRDSGLAVFSPAV